MNPDKNDFFDNNQENFDNDQLNKNNFLNNNKIENQNINNENYLNKYSPDVEYDPDQKRSSLQLDKYIEKIHENPDFTKKEEIYIKKLEDKIKQIIGDKVVDNWQKLIEKVNFILLLLTIIEFILDRFDIMSLTLCFALIFIKIELFHKKHLYKWILTFCISLGIDALYFLITFLVSIFC
jgi:hypothetical protein